MRRSAFPIVVRPDGMTPSRWQPCYSSPGFVASSRKLHINEDLGGYETRHGAAEAARILNEAAGRCPCCGAKERPKSPGARPTAKASPPGG